MVGWTIGMIGIILTGVVVVCLRQQRKARHIAYWQQQRDVEQRKGEAALRQPESRERSQKMDNARWSVKRIDGELARLTGAKG